jgi:hypothetical protein
MLFWNSISLLNTVDICSILSDSFRERSVSTLLIFWENLDSNSSSLACIAWTAPSESSASLVHVCSTSSSRPESLCRHTFQTMNVDFLAAVARPYDRESRGH